MRSSSCATGVIRIEDEEAGEGDTNVLTTLGQGDSFGELGLLGSAPRAATARADGDVTLIRVEKAAFDALLADDIAAPNVRADDAGLRGASGSPRVRRVLDRPTSRWCWSTANG